MVAGHVIRDVAEWLLISLILFALLLEFVLHKVEHWIFERHPHVQTILRNLYRELMILGVVSFAFIMFVFSADPADDTVITFEVAHIFIFLFGVLHTVVVSITVYISLSLSVRWKKLERMELVSYLELKDKYRKLTSKREKHSNLLWKHFGWWITNPSRLIKYNKLHEALAFHDIRWQFIYYRNLQPEFRFSKFLRRIKMATFIDLVEIHPLNWCLLLLLVCADLVRGAIRRSITGFTTHRNFEPLFFIAHSVLNVVYATLLAAKIRTVFWKLTKTPYMYYDTIDPHAFREELAIAEEEARIRRESNVEIEELLDTPTASTKLKHRRASMQNEPQTHPKAGLRKSQERVLEPIYHNMAFVPEQTPDPTSIDRHSLDMTKAQRDRDRPAPARTDRKPARYFAGVADEDGVEAASAPGSVTNTLLETAMRQQEVATGGSRKSLEVATVMPTQDLDLRANPTSTENVEYWARDPEKLKHLSAERRKLRMEALRRLRERQRQNAAIVEAAQDVQAAENSVPRKQYPKWIVRLIPRLGRVPSKAERLFWFGSHRFFLWSVENLLFFTNINVAASIAKMVFYFKEQYETKKDIAAGRDNVRKEPLDDIELLIAALVVSLFALLYVLLRIAGIMRKYIFVLNNANLLPEDMTITTIQTVNIKDAMDAETMHDGTGENLAALDSETDTENEDGTSWSAMRKNISRHFENQHMSSSASEVDAIAKASSELKQQAPRPTGDD